LGLLGLFQDVRKNIGIHVELGHISHANDKQITELALLGMK